MPERTPISLGQRLRAALARARDSERGSFLIEIVVSAALIGVVTIAVFAAFDSANASSGRNKARSVANSLAEQDQERLRAMPVGNLGNVSQTSTKTLDGVAYKVVSKGQWITESTGTNVSCTGAGRADYVKITSTVTWPNMRLSRAIQQDSIVSPGPGTGALGVAARQRDGVTPLQGLPVGLSGPQSLNATTDGAGCAFFGNLSSGNYTIAASLSGYTTTGWSVDPADGISPKGTAIGDTFTPAAGSTTVKTYLYDKAATVNVTFDTLLSNGTTQAEQSDHVMFENPNAGVTGTVLIGKTGAQKSSYSVVNVFPFTDSYSVYSGDCTGNNPAKYGVTQSVQADPAGVYSKSLREPAMNIFVTQGGLAKGNADVKISPDTTNATYPAMAACSTTYSFTTSNVAATRGFLPDPAMPYGAWSVCADDNNNHRVIQKVVNKDPNGTALVTMPIPSSGSSGSC